MTDGKISEGACTRSLLLVSGTQSGCQHYVDRALGHPGWALLLINLLEGERERREEGEIMQSVLSPVCRHSAPTPVGLGE